MLIEDLPNMHPLMTPKGGLLLLSAPHQFDAKQMQTSWSLAACQNMLQNLWLLARLPALGRGDAILHDIKNRTMTLIDNSNILVNHDSPMGIIYPYKNRTMIHNDLKKWMIKHSLVII